MERTIANMRRVETFTQYFHRRSMILVVALNATRLTFPLATTKYRSVITAAGNVTQSGKKRIS